MDPKEIAFFDRGPVDFDELLVIFGYWFNFLLIYYYDGYIYGTEISRGLDVFRLSPSQHLSEQEIFQKAQPLYGPKVFNPQQQGYNYLLDGSSRIRFKIV